MGRGAEKSRILRACHAIHAGDYESVADTVYREGIARGSEPPRRQKRQEPALHRPLLCHAERSEGSTAHSSATPRPQQILHCVQEDTAERRLERFTIEMALICASEDEAGKEQKRSHSGLRRVFVTQGADAATSRWATDQS